VNAKRHSLSRQNCRRHCAPKKPSRGPPNNFGTMLFSPGYPSEGTDFPRRNPMKHLLITSMIALGVGCGAAMAQTESTQPSGGDNCAAGQVDCQKGGKAGEQAQGKMKMKTEQNAQ